MKLGVHSAALLLAATVGARQVPLGHSATEEKFLVEFEPGQTRWITEEEKWESKRAGINFMDITEHADLGLLGLSTLSSKPSLPSAPSHNTTIGPLLPHLSQQNMRSNLEKFSSFYTRYYKSTYGAQSSAWLLDRVNSTIHNSTSTHSFPHNPNITVVPFPHPWGQSSIIARIPGRTNRTVVIGAHQDSINLFLPSILAAPGADDDGSGTVTILEALRTLLLDPTIAVGNATNTLEFHWYSAEEAGLLGSQAIFSTYAKSTPARNVIAMLQQDMTGYIAGTLAAGKPESVGVIMDHVDPELTAFVKKVIELYCRVPWVETQCGYACSDHASASKAGYRSAFVIESAFKNSDKRIHTTEDKVEYLDFGHMEELARMTVGFGGELVRAEES